jgi:hypothetical protein
MKILLVHPDDSIDVGAWAGTQWDLAIDLGWSGRHAYSQQTERLGFRVFSIYDFLDHEQHRAKMRGLLALGLGHLLDSESVDWWDLFSVVPYARLEQLMLVSALAQQLPAGAELFATSPHFATGVLSRLLKCEIKNFSPKRRTGLSERFRRYLKAAFALRPAQLTEIAFDKWDTDFSLRRRFVRSPKILSSSVILLPSAYANVTRAQLSYAKMLPRRRFLLVVTRGNGRLRNLPGNIEVRSIASYAPPLSPATEEERARLLDRWHDMRASRFESNSVFRLARELGVFDEFPAFLKSGLRVRDAWREVFARESITSLLSGDESNPYTRLPILLASHRKVHTVFGDHGALNMSFAIRCPASDTYLARGEMARDYNEEWCGLPADRIVVGGPATAIDPLPPPNRSRRDWIIFYSEAYELSSGRTRTLYEELLPELCLLARETNRRIIVKLHPFESGRIRKRLIHNILPAEDRALLEIREGPMTPDLFERAWCSFTVESSVAVESTVHGVPCFLLTWFDVSWYDYGKQYAKYSAGYPLDSPRRIRDTAQMLEQFQITETTRQRLQTPITPEHLEELLRGTQETGRVAKQ